MSAHQQARPKVRCGFLVGVGIGLFVVIALAIAAPELLRWRMRDSEISPAADVRQIDAAVRDYIAQHGRAPSDLHDLRFKSIPRSTCDARSCDWHGRHYEYTLLVGSGAAPRYSITARPRSAGLRSYYLDQTGVLRGTDEGRAATSSDPQVPW